MTQEKKQVFAQLAALPVKAGEVLKASYFHPGGQEPVFVITEKIDGTFTLYSVSGKSMKKMQSAGSVKVLEEGIVGQL